MKTKLLLGFIVVSIISVSVSAQDQRLSTKTSASFPSKMSYQGVLRDSTGDTLNGTYSMTFSLYDVASGGIDFWVETQTVEVNNGVFNVLLGSNNSLYSKVIKFDVPYWLSIAVEGIELSPRIELASSAYSFNTDRIGGMRISNSDAPSSGQALIWNSTSEEWEPGDVDPKWEGPSNTTGDINRTGRIALGHSTPEQLLDVRGGTIEVSPATDGANAIRVRSGDRTQNAIFDINNDAEVRIGGSGNLITLISTFGVESRSGTTWRPMRASSFDVQSSHQIKRDITYLDLAGTSNWLVKLAELKPATYHYNWQNESQKKWLGLIAEELPSELKSDDGRGVNLYALTTASVAALQSLHTQYVAHRSQTDSVVTHHQLEITALTDKIRHLQQQLTELESFVKKLNPSTTEAAQSKHE